MIDPPLQFRGPDGPAFLVGWLDAPRISSVAEARALAEALVEQGDNEAALRDGFGVADETSLDELIERVASVLATGALRVYRTQRPQRRLDPPIEVALGDLIENETPRVVSTWFELGIVDLYGRPLHGVEVTVLHDGQRHARTSNGEGVVRFDEGVSRSAQVTIAATASLREAIDAALQSPSDNPLVQSGDDTEVVFDRGEVIGPTFLRAEGRVTISVQPFVVLGRMVGMFFETDRDFLLPMSRDAVAEMRALHERCAPASVLVVGHTDTVGSAASNEALSLRRAQSVRAFLRDDVEAWLARYERGQDGRWGEGEDEQMFAALPDAAERPPGVSVARWFQETRGLEVDGDVGPETRRALIRETMAYDGTSLAGGVEVEVAGCGEAFPLDASGHELDVAPLDGVGDPVDRRVELFFFGSPSGVRPPLAQPILAPDAPGYLEWRGQAHHTYERVLGPRVLELELLDESGVPMQGEQYRVRLATGAAIEGELDAAGRARIDRLPPTPVRVEFPGLENGAEVVEMVPLEEG